MLGVKDRLIEKIFQIVKTILIFKILKTQLSLFNFFPVWKKYLRLRVLHGPELRVEAVIIKLSQCMYSKPLFQHCYQEYSENKPENEETNNEQTNNNHWYNHRKVYLASRWWRLSRLCTWGLRCWPWRQWGLSWWPWRQWELSWWPWRPWLRWLFERNYINVIRM